MWACTKWWHIQFWKYKWMSFCLCMIKKVAYHVFKHIFIPHPKMWDIVKSWGGEGITKKSKYYNNGRVEIEAPCLFPLTKIVPLSLPSFWKNISYLYATFAWCVCIKNLWCNIIIWFPCSQIFAKRFFLLLFENIEIYSTLFGHPDV